MSTPDSTVEEALPIDPVLPITGRLASVMISKFCMQPDDDFDRHPLMSFGVSKTAVAAGDGMTAIMLGEPTDELACTKRKEAEVEAARAKIFKDVFGAYEIPRLLTVEEGEDGTVVSYPDVGSIIDRGFATMKEIACVHPDALAAVAAAAKAAGVDRIKLFSPGEDPLMLGFSFDAHAPDWMIDDLFKPVQYDLPVRGVFVVRERKEPEIVRQGQLEVGDDSAEKDPMWVDAVRHAAECGMLSTSTLQRALRLGFQRASRLIDEMEQRGIVGPKDGPRPRKVLITIDDIEDYI